MRTIFSCLFLCFTAFCLNAATAVTPVDSHPDFARWEKLGTRNVSYKVDRDQIVVTARDGRFSAIKLRVAKAPIDMMRCTIYFRNGQKQEVQLRQTFPAGSESRVVDISGKRRVISKVVFWYDTKNRARKRATVELWGRR
ncbi:MAG: DUF2541 family protein [Mameliella sp.]|nr:DUF2541 family protein [Phaeodactylibacter sp.]